MIMEAEKSHSVLSASWRTRKLEGQFSPKAGMAVGGGGVL